MYLGFFSKVFSLLQITHEIPFIEIRECRFTCVITNWKGEKLLLNFDWVADEVLLATLMFLLATG